VSHFDSLLLISPHFVPRKTCQHNLYSETIVGIINGCRKHFEQSKYSLPTPRVDKLSNSEITKIQDRSLGKASIASVYEHAYFQHE